MTRRIHRLILALTHLSRAALVLLPLALGWLAARWLADPAAIAGTVPGLSIAGTLSRPMLALGIALALLPAIPAMAVLWQMQALFRLYATGETLSPAPARRIRGLGLALFATAIAGLVARPLAGLALTSANPPGERMLAISFQSNDLALILAGGLMVVLGAVLGEAAEVAEDTKGFV